MYLKKHDYIRLFKANRPLEVPQLMLICVVLLQHILKDCVSFILAQEVLAQRAPRIFSDSLFYRGHATLIVLDY